MDLTTEISYPGAGTDDVFALLMDEGFRAAVCVATGAVAHQVSVQRGSGGSGGDHVLVSVTRTVPANVPDIARRFVGDTITIVQEEHWADAAAQPQQADVEIRIDGQPARFRGTLRLVAEGGGTRELLAGELTVSIPLFGRRIEPEIAKAIVLAARIEQQTGIAWLARGTTGTTGTTG
jgi:hypothetical protein